VVDEGGELASLVETRAEETGDQLDDGGRGKEDVVLASCMGGKRNVST
jgi:hypothetical protein